MFCEEEICELDRLHPAIWRIFAELNIPLSSELAEKRAVEGENLINIDGDNYGGKHVLDCFYTRNYFE